jgi:dihydrofolate reductase
LTRKKDYQVKGAILVHSVEELLEELKKYPSEDVYCIGGDSVYRELLPYCDLAHVTKIDHAYAADAYFPNLDEMEEWEITGESDEQTYFDLEYTFLRYERKK